MEDVDSLRFDVQPEGGPGQYARWKDGRKWVCTWAVLMGRTKYGANEVAVILELAAASDTVEVFSYPVDFIVGAVGRVARSYGWRGTARVV